MHTLILLFLTTRVIAGTIELASRASVSNNDSAYSESASSALTPLGYAAAFVNTDVLASGDGYLEDFTLVDYDVEACAERCNGNKECVAFNIYFKPDHTKTSSNDKTAAIKCTLWSDPLSIPDTEIGSDVVAGSNAYNQEKALAGPGPGSVQTLPIKFPSVTQLGDTYYSVELTCDGQRMPVMLDTGSADLFLVSNECPNTPTSGCYNSTPFEIQPTTNMPVNQSFFTIVGAGPVFGNQSILDVEFGTKNIIARDLSVGLVYNAVQMEFQNGSFSGILGMGLRNVSRQFYHPKEGRLTIGGIDKEASNGRKITYSDIVDSPNYNYPGAPPAPQLWSITVDGMRFNGKNISLPASGIVSGSPYITALDSGTSFMAVGGIVFDEIADNIIGPSQSSGVVASFDCSTPQHLEIKINGQWIDINPLDLITPGDWFILNGTQMCRASVNAQSLSLADSILGVPFLRNVLAVFDYVSDDMYSVQPRIGIAPLTNWSLALEQYKLSYQARVGAQIPFPGF
ncbi:uncharacterized protein LW94_2075 [Fusarium fujikuroi]|nr:uncharacterized protein LW94_2075 [Fusarium fujikuroi]